MEFRIRGFFSSDPEVDRMIGEGCPNGTFYKPRLTYVGRNYGD